MASASARRYARAVYELAAEQKAVDRWAARLAALRDVLSLPEVRAVVGNPSLAPRRRLDAVEAVVDKAKVGEEGLNLARLLVASGKSRIVGDIVLEFEQLADRAAGRVRATATTAVEVSPQERSRLSSQLTRQLGKEVRVEFKVDPSIIGGLVLEVGDRLIDASVAGRLQQLRRSLAAS